MPITSSLSPCCRDLGDGDPVLLEALLHFPPGLAGRGGFLQRGSTLLRGERREGHLRLLERGWTIGGNLASGGLTGNVPGPNSDYLPDPAMRDVRIADDFGRDPVGCGPESGPDPARRRDLPGHRRQHPRQRRTEHGRQVAGPAPLRARALVRAPARAGGRADGRARRRSRRRPRRPTERAALGRVGRGDLVRTVWATVRPSAAPPAARPAPPGWTSARARRRRTRSRTRRRAAAAASRTRGTGWQ